MGTVFDILLSEITQSVLWCIASALLLWSIWHFRKYDEGKLLQEAEEVEGEAIDEHVLKQKTHQKISMSRKEWKVISELMLVNSSGEDNTKALQNYNEMFSTTEKREKALEIYEILQQTYNDPEHRKVAESLYTHLVENRSFYQSYQGGPE